ncbi:DUF2922 domain-containing protein [Enterococcus sp. HY326]|uniref:DUF2922 domain-containing protein n=1 Tax=Enterococcus sp. HY326 TaxID=2971265 RepID=UPI00223F1E01|nr:DUF2922 domain-containing protein [Enterococcus sp. HY326]
MKKLHLTFLNETGKKHTLRPALASESLTEEAVRQAMSSICELGIFEKNREQLFVEPDSAKYVETIETVIF